MARKKDSSESRSGESRTLGAQDALAKARLMAKSLRTPTERRSMAEANMKEQAKRGKPAEDGPPVKPGALGRLSSKVEGVLSKNPQYKHRKATERKLGRD